MTKPSFSYSLTFLTVLIGISLAASPIQSSSTAGPQGNCTKVSSCKCSYADGTVIDLSPLSRSDGTAFFSNITAKNGYVFYWNPCNPFSYPPGQNSSACGNDAICQRPPNSPPGMVYTLGKQTTAAFTKDKGGVHLSYASTPQDDRVYAANVLLKCNQTLQNSVLDADTYPPYVTNTTTIFSFILNSKYACSFLPNSSDTSTSTPKTSTSSSDTSETSTNSQKTSTSTSQTSETSQGSTGSSRNVSNTTRMHTTISPSRNAATSLKHFHCFVSLCFTLFTLI